MAELTVHKGRPSVISSRRLPHRKFEIHATVVDDVKRILTAKRRGGVLIIVPSVVRVTNTRLHAQANEYTLAG
jgi:hypothetical protein